MVSRRVDGRETTTDAGGGAAPPGAPQYLTCGVRRPMPAAVPGRADAGPRAVAPPTVAAP